MAELAFGELLFYGGIAVMTASAVIGIGTAVVLYVFGKRLKERLDEEFGEKRH